MTVVTLTGLERLLGAPGPIDAGEIEATYWAGASPFISVDGADVTFPPAITVAIVAGAPAVELDMEPTAGECCVRWVVRSSNGGFTLVRYTTIPASGPVDFGALPVVNPATFAPASDPSMLDTIQSQLLDGLTLRKVTQAEYDLIPEPRPTDVLYVITP